MVQYDTITILCRFTILINDHSEYISIPDEKLR
jgi:hypothetical protein